MKPTSLRRSSSAATQRCASGCSSLYARDALRRCDQARQGDVLRAGLAAQADRVRGRAAGRDHRIEHEHAAPGEAVRQLEVVGHRPQRLLVAADADEADGSVRQQLERGVEHAEAGAQDRHDGEPGAGQAGAVVGRHRGLHAVRLGREAARGLVEHEQRDLVHERAEEAGVGLDAAQERGLVAHHGVIQDDHAPAHPGPAVTSAPCSSPA